MQKSNLNPPCLVPSVLLSLTRLSALPPLLSAEHTPPQPQGRRQPSPASPAAAKANPHLTPLSLGSPSPLSASPFSSPSTAPPSPLPPLSLAAARRSSHELSEAQLKSVAEPPSRIVVEAENQVEIRISEPQR